MGEPAPATRLSRRGGGGCRLGLYPFVDAEVRRQKEVDANVRGCLMFIVMISFPPIKLGIEKGIS